MCKKHKSDKKDIDIDNSYIQYWNEFNKRLYRDIELLDWKWDDNESRWVYSDYE